MTIIRGFPDLPLRNKLRAIILFISGVSVLGACAVFLSYQWVSSRNVMARQLEIMAEVVSDQITAAVEFDQAPQAAGILRSLKAERQVVAAAVYTSQGRLFASYLRDGTDVSSLPARPGADGRSFEGGDLLVYHSLKSGGERIGSFYLRSDMAETRNRLLVNLATVGFVLLGASAAALFLSRRLGVLVTGPVLRLAEVVQNVSKQRDYSIRAEPGSRDELGRLIEGFNDMLSQIQARDGALAEAHDRLEQRVQERTRELEKEVSERKTAQQLLQDNEVRLTEAQEIARLGSWEWTLSSDRVTWSDEVFRISGLLPAKFGGAYHDFVDSAHPDDRGALRDALEQARRIREAFSLDYRIIRPDGAVRYLHAKGKVTLDGAGKPIRVVGTLADITERKLADQAIQDLNRELQARMADLASVNKELESFSYSVSHDLRAPLRAIGGFSQMLIEDCGDKVDEQARRYLQIIQENTKKMGQLIDDLLAFSRLGRKSVEVGRVDLERLADESFAELRALNKDRDLEFVRGPLPPAQGDTAMFRQVMVNLISNAVKYSRGRTPAVIEVGSRVEAAETTYFVRDNGVGFPMEYVHKLFGVFQRLHTAKEFEGTGVGLALVQRIVVRHGGRVWAEGRLGEGATFFFALPKKAGAAG